MTTPKPPDPNVSPPETWTWRASGEGSEDAGLLYEPGNWGDALKGSWALLALRGLLESGAPRPLRVLDVCAGQPAYPLTDAAARRMDAIVGSAYREAQSAFRERGRLASTGLLVRDACVAAGVPHELQVSESDPVRRGRWAGMDHVRILGASSGEEALGLADAELILVDPYDFFHQWGRWLTGAVEAARRALVVIYLYNKSPRGRGFADQYRRLRAQLRAVAAGASRCLLGRLASDAVRPRAYHEVLLLGPAERVRPLRRRLDAETRLLARALGHDGAIEEIGRGSDKE